MCSFRSVALLFLALGSCCHALRKQVSANTRGLVMISAPLPDPKCVACLEKGANYKWCTYTPDQGHSYCQRTGKACGWSYAKVKSVQSCPASDEDIGGNVHSAIGRLQEQTDQLDDAIETEAGQEAAKEKADQLERTDPWTWFVTKLSNAGSLMKKAFMTVYTLMKDWFVGICVWAADGGLDDVVEFVKDGLEVGFTNIKELLYKVWGFVDMILEKTKIKQMVSSIMKKVSDAVASIFGGSNSSSLLALEQNQSASLESEVLDISMLEMMEQSSLPRGIVKNSTVIEAVVPNKRLMFVLSVIVDAIGMSSYAANAAAMMGEVLDIAWAPLQALWLREFYDGSWTVATIGFLEEILPLMDVVPTALMGWFFSYNDWFGCYTFRNILWLPDRSMIGYGACPQSILSDISSKGYKITKAKSKGHLYLQCQHGSRSLSKEGEKQKASCVEKECASVGGWCFVMNHCGGWKGYCEELTEKDPLECNPAESR